MAAHAAFGMLPGVDRPALAPTVPTRQGAAVLLDAGATVECKPQHLRAVRAHGGDVRAGRARRRAAADRAAVDRRGRNEGQRADARGASAVEGLDADVRRERRSPRHFRGRCRRDGVRRIHRQRRVEAERRPRRDGRGPARRGVAEHVFEPGRLPAVAAGVPAVSQARGLLGVWRRAAARRRRPLHRRPRPIVGEGGAQCRGRWRRAWRTTR